MYEVAKVCGGQSPCQAQPWRSHCHTRWHHEDAFGGVGHDGNPGLNKPLWSARAASVDEAVLTRPNAMASMR